MLVQRFSYRDLGDEAVIGKRLGERPFSKAAKAKLEDGIDDSAVKGGASLVNGAEGTFTITASEVESAPISIGTQVKVTTTDSTVFKLNGVLVNRSLFFSTFANGQTAKVEGVYNPETLTLAAVRVILN